MRQKPTITKTVQRDYLVVITEAELRKRFRLPEDARVVFAAPHPDGDRIDLEVGESLTATWTRQK